MTPVKFIEVAAFILLVLAALSIIFVIVNACRKKKRKIIVWSAVLVGFIAAVGALSLVHTSVRDYYSAFYFLEGDLCYDQPRIALERFQGAGTWFDAQDNAALLEKFVGDTDNDTLMDLTAQYLSNPKSSLSNKALVGQLLKKIEATNDIDGGLRLLADFGSVLNEFFADPPDTARHCPEMQEGLNGVQLLDPDYQWLLGNVSERGKVAIYVVDTREKEMRIALGMSEMLPPNRRLELGTGVSAVIVLEHAAIHKGQYLVMNGSSMSAYQRRTTVKLCSVPDMRTLKDFGTIQGAEPPQNVTLYSKNTQNSYFGTPPDEAKVVALVEKIGRAHV